MARDVTSTYRLQLHSGFTFADAATQLDYLAALGISHVYLSPILQATPGSMHGYDVIDHSRISDELGGRGAFEQLATAAHSRGLGIIVDVVPNHMAIPTPEDQNRQLWELLRDGRDASTAEWFDIDWKFGGGRVGLPFLGKPLPEVLAAGEITLDRSGDEPVLRYYDHAWPLSLGTDDTDDIAELLARQHYRLGFWRDADTVLNYRRFFEVDSLIAIRVEEPEVFDATHALLLELNDAGLIDGFRIDHPDGLADPTGYLDRLAEKVTRGSPIWVEKILEPGEHLPQSKKYFGTTGYDALRVIDEALADPEAAPVLQKTWTATGGDPDYAHATDVAKRRVINTSLRPEVDRLSRRAQEALPGLAADSLRAAVVELLAACDVYRVYVRRAHKPGSAVRDQLTAAHDRAVEARPDLQRELDALLPFMSLSDDNPSALDFGIRLQQTWGPVMAKGIEDKAFYRWGPFIALNEVGSDPSRIATASVDDFHNLATRHQANWPYSLTALSTHDTKRSEDVRARLIAIAGDSKAWQAISAAASDAARDAGVDGRTAHFIWQTLLGVGPIDRERLADYLRKALREADLRTSWIDPDTDYEQKVVDFAVDLAAWGPARQAIDAAVAAGAKAIRAITLGARLVQLTMPGVPDSYQGTELVDLSLVDPDNRRPVDFERRAELLTDNHLASFGSSFSTGEEGLGSADVAGSLRLATSAESEPLSMEKLHVVHTALLARREHPRVFGDESSYRPIISSTEHLLGFSRYVGQGRLSGAIGRAARETFVTLATRAPARLDGRGGWGAATLDLAAGEWKDHITGTTVTSEGRLSVADVLSAWPVALLERLS